MPTPRIIRTPEASSAIVACLDAGASRNQIAVAAGVSPVAVNSAIEAGRLDSAPAHLRDITEAYDRQQANQAKTDRRVEKACAILRNVTGNV